ncbi:GNAT family N-acetyltransferase [Pseudocnuella soli]|uniref:GNAT family N-acetyltransferase n=1 Tax=Pseudocnuella soli TaxID=2502779 RepID=UPI0014043D93|nr:GNAT family N-acetyltransferase [Pseudocnuella soli]
MLAPNFSPFPLVKTERLLLRQFTLADAAGVHQLRSDDSVMQFINRPLTQTIGDAEAWIRLILDALQKGDGITWCMCLKDDPATHVGSIGLWRIEKENYRAEIGYMIQPRLQGKGYMYEALQAVVHYGFTEMRLHSVEARIDPGNVASAALLHKSGFVQEAHFKENYYNRGRFADTAVYSKLAPNDVQANE